jgi:hypothetical protein
MFSACEYLPNNLDLVTCILIVMQNATIQVPNLVLQLSVQSQDSSVGIALGHGLDDRVLGFDSRQGLEIFLFTTASRTALESTKPRIQWASGVLSLGVKRSGREADHSPPSSAEIKERVELYLHTPNTPYGVVLSSSTGTTLIISIGR